MLILITVVAIPELALRYAGLPKDESEPAVGTRRFVTWLSDLAVESSTGKELYQSDPKLLWRLKPSQTIDTFNDHFADGGERQPVRITVNSLGYRGMAVAPEDVREARVLCMGDSNFFGYPLDDGDAFPVRLEAALHGSDQTAGAKLSVVNGGCPGYTVVQGWKWYEETFATLDYDWLLLSYINNDAWRQPQSDLETLDRSMRLPDWLSQTANSSRVVRWLRSVNQPAPEAFVPRVSREDFVVYYQCFLEAARSQHAKVLIVDYCVYPDYQPYRDALRLLAKESKDVLYLDVAAEMQTLLQRPEELERYGELVDRVRSRWGDPALSERQHLWVYAEMYPEHLNEIGTRWLSARVANLIAEHDSGSTE